MIIWLNDFYDLSFLVIKLYKLYKLNKLNKLNKLYKLQADWIPAKSMRAIINDFIFFEL